MDEFMPLDNDQDGQGRRALSECLLALYEIALFLIVAHLTQLTLNAVAVINERLSPASALGGACSAAHPRLTADNVSHISEWRRTKEHGARERDLQL